MNELKLDIINKCRTLRLNIMQNQYNLESGVITLKEFKRQYKIYEKEIKKMERKLL